ncbi:MAG: LysM peptidoglycan-binding domain-containing protein [Anaerolineae bacterium]|nr:LysM peptidoglycan-binding domain-containing protein [Anaerolineae bacterium]
MKKSLVRLGSVLLFGFLILGMVLGNVRLAQLDLALVRTRPTYYSLASTATFFPTAEPEMPPPVASATLPCTPTPRSVLFKQCVPPDDWLPYAVQPGDTLISLAWRAYVKSYVLMRNNCLTTNLIVVGEVLYLPPGAVRTPTPQPARCGPRLDWRVAYVSQGDTLYRLAIRYGTTPAEIRWANCLWGDSIYVGQPLYLPARMVITPTWTPSATPTLIPPTFTATPSPTPSTIVTPTPSITITPTVTLTPTHTVTPTNTPTPVISATATLTPTLTSSPTPTTTPTTTFTPTPAESQSPTPTAKPTATYTPSPTAKPQPANEKRDPFYKLALVMC